MQTVIRSTSLGKKTRRASPLQIAIEKGFLTLTEVLLDAGADPMANGNALSIAVNRKRTDIVQLLLDRGVPVGAVNFESVCYSAIEKINKHSCSFKISLDGHRDYLSSLTIELLKGKEWAARMAEKNLLYELMQATISGSTF